MGEREIQRACVWSRGGIFRVELWPSEIGLVAGACGPLWYGAGLQPLGSRRRGTWAFGLGCDGAGLWPSLLTKIRESCMSGMACWRPWRARVALIVLRSKRAFQLDIQVERGFHLDVK